MGIRAILVLLGFILGEGVSFGRAADQLVLPHAAGPITLDGLSDEPAWKGIQPLPLIQQVPNFGMNPSERSEVLVAYDDQYLYVAGRLYDSEPSGIQANSKKRDSGDPSSDWFGIVLDTFNDKENALAFFTTPTGLRWDAAVFNDAQGDEPINLSWNTFWDVAAMRKKEGWFVEMRIPFSSLRFQDNEGRVVMGLITWRKVSRKNEWDIFPRIPPDWGFWSKFKPSQSQEVILERIRGRKPVYFAPYVLGGIGQSYELNTSHAAYSRIDKPTREAGLDIKYGLDSNLTLDMTLNTDFAQVEADDQQVNLTRFSLFFPEKRLFFQERASIFDFGFESSEPNRLFYSRRIGIHDGRLVRIFGGGRVVGRAGPWDIGFLSMQTAAQEDLPSENYGVFRLRRQVFNPFSYVGGILTSQIGMNGNYNLAYGLDGVIRVVGDDYLTIKWAQTFDKEKEKNPFSLAPARLYVNWQRRTIKGFGYGLSFSRAGIEYEPRMGFELRRDFSRLAGGVFFGWIPGARSPLFSHQLFLNEFLIVRNADQAVESLEFDPGWQFETKSGFSGTIGPKFFYEDIPERFQLSENAEVPSGRYRFGEFSGTFSTPQGKSLQASLTCDLGTFYDGWRTSLGVVPRWFVSSSLELTAAYQFNRVIFAARDQRFTAHVARLRALYMMSAKFSATAFIQYNSTTDSIISNVRLRYNPREGTDLYLVYNEGINTDRSGEDPVLPFSSGRTIMLKYTYTFNW